MDPQDYHAIRPAVLKSGVSLDDIPDVSAEAHDPNNSRPIHGRALIFWDPAHPGRKLDAIDTDQITPAKDCVSESLDEIDRKWKEGTFRYLMPDFRDRVHRGETFLIAGDRFAIGSSREMSPAGLLAVAEENGFELVIVCGDNMGDIFRRNALSLGLQVVQSAQAVADAQDDDEFTFDPDTRELRNETQQKSYEPVALSSKEDEIRRSGGIIAIGRREFRRSVGRVPELHWPDPEQARNMTTTEQIVWAHRLDRDARVEPGNTVRVYADLLPASDGTAPFAIHTFNQITGGDRIDPRQIAIANDHFVFTGESSDDAQTSIGKAFARRHGIRKPYYATPGDGIFHFYFPEQGLIMPGQFIPGADSHTRAYGGYGAVGIGVGSTTLGFGWSTGYVYFTPAKARRVVFTGKLQPWATGKDIVLRLLAGWGARQAQGMSVELVDRDRGIPMAYRHTIANMMAEAESLNGVFAADDVTYAWYRDKGMANLPYPRLVPGENAHWEIDETFALEDVVPMIARPFSPGNAQPAADVARERIRFDKAFIGSCTNGSYDDLLQAAMVVRAAKGAGVTKAHTPFIVFPGSRGVRERIELADERLDGESVAGTLRSVGAQIRESWCGPCFGQGPDALRTGERAITSFNRNWRNRMGIGGEGYLASPSVVAASVLVGYMASPEELGLQWNPEVFAV